MTTESMLTTVDNPFDPFTQFDEWYEYDTTHGYHSSSLLARVAMVSEELSVTDYWVAISKAIDEIIFENVSGVAKKVTREVEDAEIKN